MSRTSGPRASSSQGPLPNPSGLTDKIPGGHQQAGQAAPLGLLSGGGASQQCLLHHSATGQPPREDTQGENHLNPPRPGVCGNRTGPRTRQLRTTAPFTWKKGPSSGRGWRRGALARRRGWQHTGVAHSPVRAGQLVGGRRRDERSAAVPVARVGAAGKRRRHLQQRHVGGGQVGALARPRPVGGDASGRGLGGWFRGCRLHAGRGEEHGLRGGARRDVRRGSEGPRVGRGLLGGHQRRRLRGEAGGAVGRSSEVRVLMVL